MLNCFECGLSLTSILHPPPQCVDCGMFYCIDHIQKKGDGNEYLCVYCELEMTSGFYHDKEKNIHPRYLEKLGNRN